MATENVSAHVNHRQRLKLKVKNFGIKCLADHEVLEYFLFYSIPRKDTNGIAHTLIKRFGSLAKVFDADYSDLIKVEGVGPESALMITSLSSLFDVYKSSKSKEKQIVIMSNNDSVKYFRANYEIKRKEYMVLVCLSKTNKVIASYVYDGKDETEITFDLKRISNQICGEGVAAVILYHTHPDGEVVPSFSDIETTQKIIDVCTLYGIDFKDHVIFNEDEHYSFHGHCLIEIMKSNSSKTYELNKLYKKALTKTEED